MEDIHSISGKKPRIQNEKSMANLKPITSKEQASRLGKIGGKSRSAKKIFALRLNGRKYCNANCPHINMCPYMFESRKTKEKLCGLNSKPIDTQRRVWDILRDGSPEVKREMQRVIFKMGGLVDKTKSPKELAIYNAELERVHNVYYGKTIHNEITGNLDTSSDPDKIKNIFNELYGKKKK